MTPVTPESRVFVLHNHMYAFSACYQNASNYSTPESSVDFCDENVLHQPNSQMRMFELLGNAVDPWELIETADRVLHHMCYQ
jgi:hypothetical protein